MSVQAALEQREQVVQFLRKHRIGLLTLLFTDIVGSTQLKHDLGDAQALLLLQRHHALVRKLLRQSAEAEEISTAGDSFFIVFAKPSEAVKFALLLQAELRELARQSGVAVLDASGFTWGRCSLSRGRMPRGREICTGCRWTFARA
jgi:class 3 adenylate cyclase